MISELRGVIKSITAVESPRGPVQRRPSALHYHPDSLHSPQASPTRPVADAVPLDSQVGTALTLGTPRGRFRSIVVDSTATGASSTGTGPVTTLAEDLRVSPAITASLCNGQPVGLPFERPASRRGTLVPPVVRLPSAKADTGGVHTRYRGAGETTSEESDLAHQLRYTSEAMERALLELEDVRASGRDVAPEWQSKITRLEQKLMQAEERIRAMATEMEGLRSERHVAIAEYRETQEKLGDVTGQLQGTLSRVAELETALDRMRSTHDECQREAKNAALRLTEALRSAENEIATLRERIATLEGQLLPLGSKISETPEQHAEPPEEPTAKTATIPSPPPPHTMPGPVLPTPHAEGDRPSIGSVDGSVTKEQPQFRGKPLRGEKIKVVFRAPNDCCSPLACLNPW